MAKKKKLFPGNGARGTILTRFIKPKRRFKHDKDHRSSVVLKEFYFEGQRLCFRFDVDGEICHAHSRYVKVEEEGKTDDFFFPADKEKRRVTH